MMDNGESRLNPAPTKRRLLGCVITLAISMVILVAIFLLALRDTFDDSDAQEEARAMTRRMAETVRQQLDSIEQEGHVPDQRIVDTLRAQGASLLSLKRDAGSTIFVAEVLGYAAAPLKQVDVTICFEFTLMPANSENVTYRELDSCPPRA